MGKYFGTDGFRGEAGKELTADHAYAIGRFLGYYFKRDGKCKVAIGKDTRLSCYSLEHGLIAGLAASGADVYLLHVISTPGVSYITRTGDFDCGIMISASHNPFYDNGIKLVNSRGEKIEEEVIDEIEKYLDGELPPVPFATGADLGRVYDHTDGQDLYAGYVISSADGPFSEYKVGLDCSNGSTWKLAEKVFKALGAEVTVIHKEPNGTNINVACGSTHPEDLQKLVKEKGLDVGFAFDGDADRCLAVDADGNMVDGDKIIYINGCWMKEHGKLKGNKVVTTVMSNFGLYKALDAVGIGYEKTAVGDKYVYENQKTNGYVLGGEQSGHTIFTDYATTGDGLITAVRTLKVMKDTKKSLKELAAPVVLYPQVLKNVKVVDKETALNNAAVQAACDAVTAKLEGNGRILLRKSGTEPVLRVMVEALTHELCEECVDSVIAAMDAEGLVVEVRK
ncbi:MAG: phosphoglucosamine mutase [Clostridiales bacterium]|nr:phosphoglucosamine mutase [Clostridiales bacterium]